MEYKKAKDIKIGAMALLVIVCLGIFVVMVQNIGEMYDRYGEFRGDYFWDQLLTVMKWALPVTALITVLLALSYLLEFAERLVDIGFSNEIRSIRLKDLKTMVASKDVFDEVEMEMIKHEITERETELMVQNKGIRG